ncbi:MAG: transglycosylase domain-containing protein [Raoultibacter sp.]
MKRRRKQREVHAHAGAWGACILFLATFLILFGFIWGGLSLVDTWLKDLPDVSNTSAFAYAEKTRVVADGETADDGEVLLAEFFLENREPVTIDAISPLIISATIATEDSRFYEHKGVDPVGIARALWRNLNGGEIEGASTITQQLVRNTVLKNEATEVSFKRKIREAKLAMQMEDLYSKDEILTMYLNTINYGDGCYGVEAASQSYFQKTASTLTLNEAATIAGIPQSPTYLNPKTNPEACLARRNTVLGRMLYTEAIDQATYDAAIAEPLALNAAPPLAADGIYQYPYFTSYVRQLLLETYDDATVFKGGLTVYTTLDIPTQKAAEVAAANKEATIADDLEVALTAIDPDTGYIKALVGGRDYYTDEYNLATQAHRPPGSSFKTFTLITALEAAISPQTTVDCSSPVTLGTWRVENYGNAQYGTRTIADAFAISSNTAFARLITYLTPEKVVEVAQRMGIETHLEPFPALTLGAQDVTVKEMAGAYATIANGGTQRTPVAIKKVLDSGGTDITPAIPESTQALTPEIAYAATKVMKGVITGGTGTAARLANGQPAAGKTGTSEDWKDSYFCGITPQLSVAVWLGARVGRPIPEGITATSVFSDFMNRVLVGQPIEQFPTAKDPTYKPVTDATLHIGSSGYSGYSGSSGSSGSRSGNYGNGNGNGNYSAPAPTPSPNNTNSNSNGTDNTARNDIETNTASGTRMAEGESVSEGGAARGEGGGASSQQPSPP